MACDKEAPALEVNRCGQAAALGPKIHYAVEVDCVKAQRQDTQEHELPAWDHLAREIDVELSDDLWKRRQRVARDHVRHVRVFVERGGTIEASS